VVIFKNKIKDIKNKPDIRIIKIVFLKNDLLIKNLTNDISENSITNLIN
jgi:hypothetical protein